MQEMANRFLIPKNGLGPDKHRLFALTLATPMIAAGAVRKFTPTTGAAGRLHKG
jgi:hypothetical protein